MFKKVIIFVIAVFVIGIAGCFSVFDAFAYTASITTGGVVNIDIVVSGDGANLGSDNINIISTCPYGYNVSIAGPTNSSLFLNGDNNSINTIPASTGTVANPVSILGNNLGTWGYTTDANATINSNFIGLTSTETLLASKATASATGGDTINVFFGVSVTPTTAPGNYTLAESSQGAGDNTITYALIPNVNCANHTVSFDANGGSGDMQGQSTVDGTPAAIRMNEFVAPSNKIFIGWNTEPDGTGTSYSDGEIITGFVAEGENVVLYAQWACIVEVGMICYDDNHADSPTTMNNQVVNTSDEEVMLSASNFQRDGYGFAGWNTEMDGSGVNYGTIQTVDDVALLDAAKNTGVRLYANWVAPEEDALGNDLTFQTSNLLSVILSDGATLNSKPIGYVTALRDIRDNEVYAVAKLADGNYWMIENLRLADKDKNNNPVVLTSSNTNNPSLPIANRRDQYTGAVQVSSSSLSAPSSSWCDWEFAPACAEQSNVAEYNSVFYAYEGWYSYGNRYNWYSATAGNGTDDLTYNDIADGDICSVGWHLPYGGVGNDYRGGNTSGGFVYLNVQMGGSDVNESDKTLNNAWRSYPNNFLYGSYWTATANYNSFSSFNPSTAFHFYLGRTYNNVWPGDDGYFARYSPARVRCVISPEYTVHFDANGGSGTMSDQRIAVNQATRLSYETFDSPAVGVSYQDANGVTHIPTSAYTYWKFTGWNTAADGSGVNYNDGQLVTGIASINTSLTLYAQWEGVESMLVDFNGNGCTFDNNEISNTLGFYTDCGEKYVSAPSYSHSDNVEDDGTSEYLYESSINETNTVRIQGADFLHVKVSYGLDYGDYLIVYEGESTKDDVAKSFSSGSGNNVEFYIPGDAVTFDFSSDEEDEDWGYYAIIEGYYLNEPGSYDHTDQSCIRVFAGGNYKEPVGDVHHKFKGWSEDSSATTATYNTVNDVFNDISGNDLETKTLYAIYDDVWTMTFVNTATGATQTNQFMQGSSVRVTPPNMWKSPIKYYLAGWDTNSAGTNVVYNRDQYVNLNGDITLYAVWRRLAVITFINPLSNNQSLTDSTIRKKVVPGNSTTTSLSVSWSNPGYRLIGWDTNSAGTNVVYSYGASISPNSDIDLYAVWEEIR